MMLDYRTMEPALDPPEAPDDDDWCDAVYAAESTWRETWTDIRYRWEYGDRGEPGQTALEYAAECGEVVDSDLGGAAVLVHGDWEDEWFVVGYDADGVPACGPVILSRAEWAGGAL